MKNLFLITFTASLFIFSTCDDDLPKDTIIIYDKGNTTIELLSIEDSRCPAVADCIWAGTAKVEMKIRKGGNMEDFFLHTNAEAGSQKEEILGDSVILLKVLPYPDQPEDLIRPLKDYTIIVDVK